MRLQRLTALESDKVRAEHAELLKTIGELRAILGDESRIDGVIKAELAELGERYARRAPHRDHLRRGRRGHRGHDRRPADGDLADRLRLRRSGCRWRPTASSIAAASGVTGMNLKEGDYIEHLHICSTHDFLLFFTNRGKVYRLKVYELPEGARTAQRQGARQRAAAPRRRAGDGRDPDPRLHRGQVPGVRDRQAAGSRRPSSRRTTPRSAPTGSSRSRSATTTSSSRSG